MTNKSTACQVVIVEDDPDVRGVVQLLLEDFDYAVESAADASTALALLDRRSPSVVLLDCHLAGGGTTEILAMADVIGANVVLMSGDSDMLAQLAAFGYFCLHKPFSSDALIRTVEQCVGRARPHRRPDDRDIMA